MTDLLKMIEEVDPENTIKLDEIDARFECITRNELFDENHVGQGKVSWPNPDSCNEYDRWIDAPEYTRSLDAIKAVEESELEGWHLRYYSYKDYEHVCVVHRGLKEFNSSVPNGFLPTEQLARLHAVIQAIEYERKRDE